ncbi:LysR family transcriptional regulator [Microvirga tunisiensis]|uniref:LysR family transcriptional regulator n=1 Tax=Pannonibacter tanglangensis TaxID=2750084 RepID=A0A7X5F4W3_9HYPH|nr:LysR family transcriptional regulator [Pannonibacter sp. XCT-53]NBN79564.1 LysR family transcriptional regulator [Pannonibacter sp. XCT-53]
MLHSRVLRYIDEVARSGSIRAAADRLNVAASAINKHVLQLEQVIGAPLFERLPRGLRLTPAGEILLAHIRRTLREYSEVEAEIRDLTTLESGEVIVATMNGLAGGIVPKAAALFAGRHPRIRITIRVMARTDIVAAVAAGEADLGLAFNLPAHAALETVAAFDARLGAVVSPAHPLAGQDSVTLAACLAHPLIFPDRRMVMHDLIAGSFTAAGLTAEPAFQTNSIEAMKQIAASGDGIVFLSRFDVAEDIRRGLLVHLPVRDGDFAWNVLHVVCRERRVRGLGVEMFCGDLVRVVGLV